MQIYGSIVALVTPFTEQGDVDFSALRRLVDFHLEHGSNGLVIAGTTGESATLIQSEFTAVLDSVVAQVDGSIPVIAGTGTASTARSIEQTQLAAWHGADAALIVTPYYNRPVQLGLEAHYMGIADAVDLPIWLYNVPSRTAVDLLPETVARLSAHSRIVGIKEAAPGMERIAELKERCDDDFVILSGDDHSMLEAMKHGAQGVISVAANVVPERIRALCETAAMRDWESAVEQDDSLRQLYDILMIQTNPIPVKWFLFEMQLIGPHIRLPLTRLDPEFRENVRRCLQGLGLSPD